jgi:hypothetical protein
MMENFGSLDVRGMLYLSQFEHGDAFPGRLEGRKIEGLSTTPLLKM